METSNKFKSSNNWLQPPAMISAEVRTAMSNNEITSTSNLRLPPTPRISSAVSDEIRPDLSPVHGGSLLTVQHAWPARRCSLDGETLRSRSDSFVSTANTVFRSRAGSTARSEVESGEYDDVSLSMALTPDPRHKQDFQVADNRFAFSPGQLNKLLNPKSLAAFRMLGGLDGLASGLRMDLVAGLSTDERRLDGYVTFEQATGMAVERKPEDDSEFQKQEASATAAGNDTPFADRLRIFGRNQLPDRQRKGFLGLLWDAYNDKIMILLTIAAVISLSLGMYEALSGGSRVDWIEGVAICVTILLVTVVTAANDWQKERQFAQLSKHNNDREVKVIRSGKPVMVSVFEIKVGDVLSLEPGDSPPTDGVLISGHGIRCDESSATGESDQMQKITGDEVWQRIMDGTAHKELDPFIISGSKVLEGVGTFLVTSVGPYSTYGRILASTQVASEPTPLQVKLGRLANWIGLLGSGAAILLFLTLFIRFLAWLPNSHGSPASKGQDFMDILIVAVTVIVVAIPEGLPLAVTLALAFATTRMVKEHNLVRILRACETMGNATVICSDKTGTLTQNRMTVVAGTLLADEDFDQLPIDEDYSAPIPTVSEIFRRFPAAFQDLIIKSIALNSIAFEEEKKGRKELIGSKTEVAMLQLASDHFGMNLTEERANATMVQLFPFDSSRKCMGVVYREPSVGYRFLVKGASELMLRAATHVATKGPGKVVTTEPLSDELRRSVSQKIDSYAQKSLRTIGMIYKDFPSWPPSRDQKTEGDPAATTFEDLFEDMIWIGVVGIQDPLRPEVPAAIKKCKRAGVEVKMVTGDNMATATAIAASCGMDVDGEIMEGPKFRQLSDIELDDVVPRLRILARSSPEDKRILVEHLKRLGETVAVTGDGTNDGPALKAADVGFSMGIAGTEVAKEASSIILLDDNFKSIVTAIAWGRAVNDAVSKFLQFQITVNITAVCLTFLSAIYNSSNKSVLTAVQLLWVNLIMDTFAALALATDAPTDKILDRKPTPKSAPLFTITMWKMIIGQAVYQLAITLTLYFAGGRILGYNLHDPQKELELNTIIFNTFVWMQIFNEFNNRRLDNRLNIFEGMWKNYWFLGINCIMIGGQLMIIFVGSVAFSVTPLDVVQWAICIACAICCLPWAIVLRQIPDEHFEVVFNFFVHTAAFIFRPLMRVLIRVTKPIGKSIKAACTATKRFGIRAILKKRDGNGPAQDEEAGSWTDSKQKLPSQQIELPPITITTTN